MREWTLYSFLVLIIGLSFAATKVRAGRHITFSEQAAMYPLTYIVFALSLTACAILMFVHSTVWLAPRLGLGDWFAGLMAVGCSCIVVAGWVPASTGLKRRIHYYAAYGIIVCILLVIASVSLAPRLSVSARNVELFVLAILGMLWGLIHRKPDAKHPLLYYEALYFASFFVGMAAAAYL